MRSNLIVFAFVAAFCHTVSAGEIRRCVGANGEAMFTNMTCPVNTRVEHVASYEPVPDSPVERVDPAANAAAASARQAREAAEDAMAAADAARFAYEQAAARMQSEQAYGNGYEEIWVPYYAGFGGSFHGRGHGHGHDHGHHRPHDMAGARPMGGQTAAQQPHVQPVRFARHR